MAIFERCYRLTILALIGLGWSIFAAAQGPELEKSWQKSLELVFESPAVIVANGHALTEAELFTHLEGIPRRDRAGYVSKPKRIADAAQLQMDRERIARAGVETGLLDDPMISADLYRMAMDELAERQLKRVVEERKLDSYEEQARELYLATPERFREKASYSFTHLLIRTAERTEAEAMRKILSLQEQAEAGADFDELVESNSEDGTVEENNGTYKSVPPDQLDQNFAQALGKIERHGEISGPVRSRFGWHLIRLDEIHEARVPSWEEAQARAIDLAEQRHEKLIREKYLHQIASEGQLEVSPGLVERIQRRYGGLRGSDVPAN